MASSNPHFGSDNGAIASRLLAAAEQSPARKVAAPVDCWNPPLLGDLDLAILRDGTWRYQGSPIRRESLVLLFSRILRREPDRSYSLVTPVERWRIRVEDVPFVAVDFSVRGRAVDQEIEFLTNVGDRVIASAEHPIRIGDQPDRGAYPPYVEVRRGLEARLDRKTYHRLAEFVEDAEGDAGRIPGVRSAGVFFPLLPSDCPGGVG